MRNVLVALVALAVVATSCGGSDDTADTAATVAETAATISSTTTAEPQPRPEVDLFAVFEANGIEVIDDPAAVESVDGLQVWSFQVENMQREIANESGIFGFELDEVAGAPSGMPFSYLVAGWITAAGTPAAEAAGGIMGEQPWEFAPSLVYPNAVLVLFVADSLIAEGAIGSAAAGPPTVLAAGLLLDVGMDAAPEIVAQGGLCTRLSRWVNGVLDWVFEGLKFDTISDRWYGWAQRVWNGAVDLARGIVETGIEIVTEVVLAPIRKALVVVGTVSMVMTHVQPWTVDIRPASRSTELATGNEPQVVEVASVFADTGVRDPWPSLVKDCASVAGLELPDPRSATGSEVSWSLENSFPVDRASILPDPDEKIGTDNHATMRWTPGRDNGDAPFPGWIDLAVTVQKSQIDDLQGYLITLLTEAILPAGDYAGRVAKIFERLTEPAWSALVEILEITDRQRVTVIHHLDVDFEYPTDDLETYEDDDEGGGDGRITLDIGRATSTNQVLATTELTQGPFPGHPDFTVWLVPSHEDCQLRIGVPFDSNDPACSFRVDEGPPFLVGKVLSTVDEDGRIYYAWQGPEGVDEMLAFISAAGPRCLDLTWYFRIFEIGETEEGERTGGIMVGYPQGLAHINEIDKSDEACLVLATSTTTEYSTSP